MKFSGRLYLSLILVCNIIYCFVLLLSLKAFISCKISVINFIYYNYCYKLFTSVFVVVIIKY